MGSGWSLGEPVCLMVVRYGAANTLGDIDRNKKWLMSALLSADTSIWEGCLQRCPESEEEP